MYTFLDQIRDHVVLGAFIIALGSYFWLTTRSQNARIEQLREKYTLGAQPRRKVAKYLPPLPLPQPPQSSTKVQQPEQKPFTGLVTAPEVSFSAYDRPPELQVSIRPVRYGKAHDQKEQYLPILARQLPIPYEGPRQDFYSLTRRNIAFEPARRVDLGTHNSIPTYEAANFPVSHPDFGQPIKGQRRQQRELMTIAVMHRELPLSNNMPMPSDDENTLHQRTRFQNIRANNPARRTRNSHASTVILPYMDVEGLNPTPSKRSAEEQATRRKTAKMQRTNRIYFQSSDDETDFAEDEADTEMDNLPKISHANEDAYKKFEERILKPEPVRREHTRDLHFQDDEGLIDESLQQPSINKQKSRSTKRPKKSSQIEREVERSEQISKKRKASPQSTTARQPKAIRMPEDSLWRPDGTIAEEDEKKENVDSQGISIAKEPKVTFATPNISGKRPREPLRPDTFVEPQQIPRTSQSDFDFSNVTPRQTPSYKYMHDIVKGVGTAGNNRPALEKKDVATSYEPPTLSSAASRIKINATPTRPTTLRTSFLPDSLSSTPAPPPRPLANYTLGTPLKKKPDLRKMTEDEVEERARRLLKGDTGQIRPAQEPISDETTKNPIPEKPAQLSILDSTWNTEPPISFGSTSGSTTLITSTTFADITKPITNLTTQSTLHTLDTKANSSVPSNTASAPVANLPFSFLPTPPGVSKPAVNTSTISSNFFSVPQSQEQKPTVTAPFSFVPPTSTISSFSSIATSSIMSRLGEKNDNTSLTSSTFNIPSYIPTTTGFGGNSGFGASLTSTTDPSSVIPAPIISPIGISTSTISGFTNTPITTGEQMALNSIAPSSTAIIPSLGLTNTSTIPSFTHITSTSTNNNATTTPLTFGFGAQTMASQTSAPQMSAPQILAPQLSTLQTSASAPQTAVPSLSTSPAPFSFTFGAQTPTITTTSSAPLSFSFAASPPASTATNFGGTFNNIPTSTAPFTSVTQSSTALTTSKYNAPSTSVTSFGAMTNPVSNTPPFGTTSATPTPFNTTAPLTFGFGAPTSTTLPSTGFNSGAAPSFGSTPSTPAFGTFGSTASPMDTGSGFGNTTSTSSSFFTNIPSPAFTFGNQTTATPSVFNNTTTQSGFGAPGQSTMSVFNAPPATSGPTTNFSNFSAPTPATGFGTANFSGFNSQPPAATFGSTSASMTGFGAQPPPTGTGFGASSGTGFGASSGTGFGALSQAAGTGFGAPSQAAGTGFGAPSQTAGTGFGAPSQAAGTGFGAPSQAVGTGFGAPSQTAGTGFGAPSTGFGTAPSAGFGFGASNPQPSMFSAGQPQATTPSMFGAQQSGFGVQTAGGFNIGQTQQPGQVPYVFGAGQAGAPGVQFNMGTSHDDRKIANPKSRAKGRQRR